MTKLSTTIPPTRFAPNTFSPAPGRASLPRMLVSQIKTETILTLRNSEQILLNILIPVAVLLGLILIKSVPIPQPREGFAAARVCALAIMSSAFTGQAIALGFDRKYGIFKRLATTSLPRWLLIAGRIGSGLLIVAIQLGVLCGLSIWLGWRPTILGMLWMIVPILLGVFAFGALGVWLGGALRAEIVLAAANIIWVGFVIAGGLAITAVASLTPWAQELLLLLPSAAIADGLDKAMVQGSAPSLQSVVVLVVWGIAATVLAIRTTKIT